jgi:hypothetical protein
MPNFLETQPRGVFFNWLSKLNDPMKRYYSNQYNDIYGQYEGEVAGQAMAGKTPDLQFNSFLGKFPWLQDYWGLTDWQRGDTPNRLAPRTRWLNF